MPDEQRIYPRQAAEAVRSFLMVRVAFISHRQKNLRELRMPAA